MPALSFLSGSFAWCFVGRRFSPAILLGLLACSLASSSTPVAADEYRPDIAAASDEGQKAITSFRIPAGTRLDLVAAEPLVANAVAFTFDEQGRLFVCETFRQSKGVEDNRGHMNWLVDDLSAQTVADRLAYFRKYVGEGLSAYTKEHDRIRQLVDQDGDGVYETATVFADGFNAIEDGTGAGVLAIEGHIYYTCIPKLWQLIDRDQDGVADERTVLSDGYGVRVAFRGHDLHGLALGPDGRIYFSLGDRGYHVATENGVLAAPAEGAVFRCELDGSHLEVFARGLRNPQELAFDDFGRLFTGDNNSDGGDKARWVYVMPAGDSGWRMYYQYLSDRGPWNRERIWHPPHAEQPAYIVPPITNVGDGPSGLVAYPGVGLAEKFQGHFFMADFRGTPGVSGIRSWTNAPKGAGFTLENSQEYLWSILATDVEFGNDGQMYLSDWVDGWNGAGKGRIYRVVNTEWKWPEGVTPSDQLLRAGFGEQDNSQLTALLTHPDRRIRQRAQMELARRGEAKLLAGLVRDESQSHFARLHALFGLGQIARRQPDVLSLVPVRSIQTEPRLLEVYCRVVAEANWTDGVTAVRPLITHVDAFVKAASCLALARIGDASDAGTLFAVATAAGVDDPFLRHAAITGLAGAADVEQLTAAVNASSPAARRAAAVALRRIKSPELARFLNDAAIEVALEAARGIYDLPIVEALPQLAQLSLPAVSNFDLEWRVIAANFQLGAVANAERVASLVANPRLEERTRLEALAGLKSWNNPPPLDRWMGDYRPLEKRELDLAPVIRRIVLPALAAAPQALREAIAEFAAELGIPEVEPVLVEVVRSVDASGAERAAALKALAQLNAASLDGLVKEAFQTDLELLQLAAAEVLATRQPAAVIPVLAEWKATGSVAQQQLAVRLLAGHREPAAVRLLADWGAELAAGQLRPELMLDVIEAAATADNEALRAAVQTFNESRPTADPLRDFRESVAGGDIAKGQAIFFQRDAVSCRRCHKIAGNGGEVGPDLTRVGAEKTSEYLLEAIVDPSRQIARGYETLVLQMADGQVLSGIVKLESETELALMTPSGDLINVDKSEIEERTVGKSGMPDDLYKKLTKADLRDLTAYLKSLDGQAANSQSHGEHGAAGRPVK